VHVACPPGVVSRVSDTPAIVQRAVQPLIPKEYARLRSMGQPAWPHARVVGVVSVSMRSAPLRSTALRLCGEQVADSSWTVFVEFPSCQIPCSEDVALVARTKHGWRFWYDEYRRP
jgi:hypothetical protein